MILTAFHGFCMALADSVPGVSGGTIAFILGFYDRFLDALHSLFGPDAGARRAAIVYLLKLGIGWAFGMLACVLALSIRAIRAALRKYRSQMVWLVLGLMAGSLCAIVMGPAGLDAPQPPVSLQTFDWFGFALGVAALLGLEALRKWTARHGSETETH